MNVTVGGAAMADQLAAKVSAISTINLALASRHGQRPHEI
jgi:hypothetical protein